ncbi:MAG TPA: helix-turn-helix domain-containing protein [Burkholderiaceae bacterium]|nr:helix-turn-helix domain-containing protein [Burkholderiaceae bacterium]
MLFRHFWERRGEARPVEAAVMQCLTSYDWPGNVRELENLVERVSVCAEGEAIRLADLPLGIRAPHLESVQGTVQASVEVPPAAEAPAMPELAGPKVDFEAPAPASVAASASNGAEAGAYEEAAAAEPLSLQSLASMAAELRQAERAVNGRLREATGNTPTPIMQFPVDLPTMLRELENRYINAALVQTGSNKKEAAKLLGMGRTTLVEKLRRRATDERVVPAAEDSSASST